MKTVISGIGPFSPMGTGAEDFFAAAGSGVSFVRPLCRVQTPNGLRGGEISASALDAFESAGRFRRAADLSKYGIAASDLALEDAGILSIEGSSSALIMAVTHGAMNYSAKYHSQLVTGDKEDISPILFSDSVLNAPAGNLSIHLGIQGAVHTLTGSNASFIRAVAFADRMLMRGDVNSAMVVAAEELSELSSWCRNAFGCHHTAEGACALVLQRSNDSDSAGTVCRIAGYSSLRASRPGPEILQRAVSGAFDMAGLTAGDIALALVDSYPGYGTDVLQGIPGASLLPLTGNAFAVSSAWSVAMASLIIRTGTVPCIPGIEGADLSARGSVNILVCSLDDTEAASALVISGHLHQ